MATPQIKETDIPAFSNPLTMADNFLGDQDDVVGRGTLEDIFDLFATTPVGVNVQSGTTYTLQASDNNKVLVFTNGSAITITLPEQNTETLTPGFTCIVRTAGAGAATFATEGSDVLVGNTGTGANATSDAGVVLRQTVSTVNTWDVFGGAA